MADPQLQPDVQDAYGLSHLQAGMLFHAQSADRPGFDVEQIVLELRGPLDRARMRRAWQTVVARHAVLRTRIRFHELREPRQEVVAAVDVPWTEHDGRGGAFPLDELLHADRTRGFDLESAPLMRCTLVHRGADRAELIWTLHHIILDGRSFPLVLREVFTVYAAEDGPAPQPDLPPYHTYIDWLGSVDHEQSRAFWTERLRGFSQPTALPLTSFHRSPQPSTIELTATLTAAETNQLEAALEPADASLNTALQAAWSVLLARYAGDEDVVFGATRACRYFDSNPQAKAMVGLFINTLPLRAQLRGATVEDLLRQLRTDWIAQRPVEHTPLVDVHRFSELPAGTPLFETLVVYDSEPLAARICGTAGELEIVDATLHEQPTFPLVLLGYGGERLRLKLLFDDGRFERGIAERMLAQVAGLLRWMASGLEQPVAEAPVLSPAEHTEIVRTWNDTGGAPPRDRCLHEDFAEQARQRPLDTALRCAEETWSYARLEATANRLAHRLLRAGAGAGVRVGICLERAPALVAGLLAIAKTGATYVPLDAELPLDRRQFIAEDADLGLLLTQQELGGDLQPGCPVLLLHELGAVLEDGPDPGPPVADLDPDRPAYVIYTSGSTGRPKGVVVHHRSALNTIDWVNETYAVGPGDCLLFVTSVCFDLSVYDVFGVLGAGACLRIARAGELADPAALAARLTSGEITFWDSAPAFLQQVAPFLQQQSAPPSTGGLRLVFLSGDWIPVTLPERVTARFPGCQIISLGGATEASIWSNFYAVQNVGDRWPSIPYGTPIRNCRYHVLDSALRPMPAGATGELFIGGDCVVAGYHRRDELTAERFIPDPFHPGQRLYRTGDLARYDSFGTLEFLGRADNQVKVRGYRVELGEIEAALGRCRGVAEAIVVAPRDADGTRSIVGFVEPSDRGAVDADLLRVEIERWLPSYMVPGRIEILERWPLSPNGKVDRAALERRPGHTARAPSAPAETDLERQLVAIWCDLLNLDAIGRDDNFFDLGGHSLRAAQLVAEIERRLGARLPLESVLQAPTVRQLGATLEQGLGTGSGSSFVHFNAGGHRDPVFLIAGIGGQVFMFREMAQILGVDQPLYAGKAIGIDGRRRTPDRVEDIAAQYLTELLELQPTGRYRLGGYSFGGLIAFEVAARLRASGREVTWLGLFDTLAPGYPRRKPLPQRLREHLRNLLAADNDEAGNYLRERLHNIGRRIRRRIGMRTDITTLPGMDARTQDRFAAVEAALNRAKWRYRPSHKLDVPITVFCAEEGFDWPATTFDDPGLGWSRYTTAAVHHHAVPGSHLELFQAPNVGPLSQRVREQLAPSDTGTRDEHSGTRAQQVAANAAGHSSSMR